jgi:tetratricopeptide (TPR) repeat protein
MQQRADELNKVVEKYLKAGLPNPDGVDPCIELGVLYLDQEKMSEAEALFKRMTERRPPSAYYYVGRLGLAVIDALKEEYRAAQDKFKELFSPSKLGDQRKKILDTYLAKHPDFAGWVNEARSNTPTVGATPSPNPGGIPKGGFPSWSKFRKK